LSKRSRICLWHPFYTRAKDVFFAPRAAEARDDQWWLAQKIVRNALHPDTGEVVPMPFRCSGFVPFGSGIV
jgi:hypothetical protein